MSHEIKLFATTEDARLWVRDPLCAEKNWEGIDSLLKTAVGMASIGSLLFCATADGRLLARLAVLGRLEWADIGHASQVLGMTASGEKLFVVTASGQLWQREPVLNNKDWTVIGQSEEFAKKTIALAAGDGKLYIATKDNELFYRRLGVDSKWRYDGSAHHTIALAATAEKLFAVNKYDELACRDLAGKDWKKVGDTQPVKVMTAGEAMPKPAVELDDVEELRTGTEG